MRESQKNNLPQTLSWQTDLRLQYQDPRRTTGEGVVDGGTR